jgi:hypothetical protein
MQPPPSLPWQLPVLAEVESLERLALDLAERGDTAGARVRWEQAQAMVRGEHLAAAQPSRTTLHVPSRGLTAPGLPVNPYGVATSPVHPSAWNPGGQPERRPTEGPHPSSGNSRVEQTLARFQQVAADIEAAAPPDPDGPSEDPLLRLRARFGASP